MVLLLLSNCRSPCARSHRIIEPTPAIVAPAMVRRCRQLNERRMALHQGILFTLIFMSHLIFFSTLLFYFIFICKWIEIIKKSVHTPKQSENGNIFIEICRSIDGVHLILTAIDASHENHISFSFIQFCSRSGHWTDNGISIRIENNPVTVTLLMMIAKNMKKKKRIFNFGWFFADSFFSTAGKHDRI